MSHLTAAGVFKRVRFVELFRGFDNVDNVDNDDNVIIVDVVDDIDDGEDKQLKRDWSQQGQGFVRMG